MEELQHALRRLILERRANTQEGLCAELGALGYTVNQSTVSRLLRKIGATKVEDEMGRISYIIPREGVPLPLSAPLKNLIREVVMNETLVVILTSPGAASMIARVLDYRQSASEILATIAGDDTLLVVPKSVTRIKKLLEEIETILNSVT